MKKGYKLVTDGTDNHLVLWDLRKEVRPSHRLSCYLKNGLMFYRQILQFGTQWQHLPA